MKKFDVDVRVSIRVDANDELHAMLRAAAQVENEGLPLNFDWRVVSATETDQPR
jgi:hypothetical protein